MSPTRKLTTAEKRAAEAARGRARREADGPTHEMQARAFRDAHLRRLALQGLARHVIAERLGLTEAEVVAIAKRVGTPVYVEGQE